VRVLLPAGLGDDRAVVQFVFFTACAVAVPAAASFLWVHFIYFLPLCLRMRRLAGALHSDALQWVRMRAAALQLVYKGNSGRRSRGGSFAIVAGVLLLRISLHIGVLTLEGQE
jgi:hypothetical protein